MDNLKEFIYDIDQLFFLIQFDQAMNIAKRKGCNPVSSMVFTYRKYNA